MTEERLQKLSIASLHRIASNEGIKGAEDLPREELIELILEAMAEERLEREQTNNSAIRIEGKKYNICRDEELESQETREFCIPDEYPETTIHLMLRDPFWAFSYWDIKTSDIEKLKKKHLCGLVLRVQMTDPADSFDIPIKNTDSKWYINLPESGRDYFIEMVAKLVAGEEVLCTSNTVSSPCRTISESFTKESLSDGSDPSHVFTGIFDLVDNTPSDKIPQRIIQFINANNFNFKS